MGCCCCSSCIVDGNLMVVVARNTADGIVADSGNVVDIVHIAGIDNMVTIQLDVYGAGYGCD